jgi:hypothetical protein
MGKAIEAEIDKLFQLPPDQFTAARNALAKGGGAQAAAIKALTKPPIAAWAVNRLYWQNRERYEALVEASNEMRKTHRAVIEGRKGDLRTAGREHEAALDAALKSTLALLKDAGQPATDTTRHAILNTLRALPSDEAPGRLTKALTPGGFELLAGVTPAAPTGRTVQQKAAPRTPEGMPGKKGRATADTKAEREAARAAAKERERRATIERAVRDADQRARQAEFEAARAVREASKAERRLESSHAELEAARQTFADAEKDAAKAARARETADRRLRDARSALDAAKGRT